ncbi:MAG TPA: DNA translocase FtsK, partial [Bacteroidetes bacterium]|nr:DNA translocase FtsK [Bacteroidota bacterium]
IFLSIFGLAGSAGVWIVKILKIVFGVGYGIFPVILAGLGFLLLNPEKYFLKPLNYLGLIILIFSYSGLFHLTVPLELSFQAIKEGRGGGYIGWSITYPLLKVMDFWPTLVILLALLFIGFFLGFNISIQDIKKTGSQTINLWRRLTSWMFVKFNQEEIEDLIEEEEAEEEVDLEEGEEEEAEEEVDLEEGEEEEAEEEEAEGEDILLSSKKVNINIPLKLLNLSSDVPRGGDIEVIKEKIRKTLENFGVEVEMSDVSVGPTVTQYTLIPAEGVKLSRIVALNNDLALALAAHPIRIEAPIPGKSLVGIEVPNKRIAKVTLREVIDSREFKKAKSPLPLAIGKDVAGKSWALDLDKMPHLLVAGATNSGKSVAINCLLVSLMYRNNPDEVKFILVDPKRVELSLYNDIPYLLTPVITEVQKTINALRWVVGEMDKRYLVLADARCRNISEYNQKHPENFMPYIILVIDELADLMAVAFQEVEGAIVRLAQMARAVGIHLVLATQRPSVDVITGLIKANITSRIAFAVASQTDSRTIIDKAGAEKLLGRGDMLLITPEITKPKRLQGAFVSSEEVARITAYIRKQVNEVEYIEEVTQTKKGVSVGGDFGSDETDPLLTEARRLVIQAGKASASYLQRRLRIGYSRAARLLDFLEDEGTIGPSDGARPREVLVNKEDFGFYEESEEKEDDNNEVQQGLLETEEFEEEDRN